MARRYAVWSGMTAGLLFAAGSAIWALDMPPAGTPPADVVAFYRDTADRIVVGGSLSLLAIAAFVVFAADLRHVLTDALGDDLLTRPALAGAILGMGAGLGAESINMAAALRARDGELNEALAQSLFEVSQILGSAATGVGLGLFALSAGMALLRTRTLVPRWVSLVTLATGLVLLSPIAHVQEVAGAAMVLLALMISIGLLRGTDEISPPAGSTT
jgi:hypothetical protein